MTKPLKQSKIDEFCEFAPKYLHEKHPLTIWYFRKDYEFKDHIAAYLWLEINGESIWGKSIFPIDKIKGKKSWPSFLDEIVKKVSELCIETFFDDQPYHLYRVHGEGYVNALKKAVNQDELKNLYNLSSDQKKSLT
jgi:hypothetical protein